MERITLRGFQDSDVEAVFSYRSLETVARYQYWRPFTKEETVAFISQNRNMDLNKEGEWNGYAIVLKKNNEVVGDCALKIAANKAEVGCNISPVFQYQGLAKEALGMLFSLAFDTIGVDEIVGITDSDNEASIKLMESMGMNRQAFEEKVLCKGYWCVEYTYKITAAER